MTREAERGVEVGFARVCGQPGDDVNAWGITKKGKLGRYERCDYPAANGVHAQSWPLSELTAETILERWGAGDYRVAWFVHDPQNEEPGQRFRGGGSGTPFKIVEPEIPTVAAAPPASAVLPAASLLPPGFEQAMQFMALIDQRSTAQLERTMQLAAAMGGNRGGLDATTLIALMGQQQEQTAKILAAVQAQHEQSMGAVNQQLAAIRADLDGEEETEETPGASLAAAVAPSFMRKGEGLKEALFNYAAANPAEVFGVLRSVPAILAEITKVQQQQQPAPPASQPRPRAVPVRALEPARPPSPGLNSLFATQAPPPDAPPEMPPAVDNDADTQAGAAAE